MKPWITVIGIGEDGTAGLGQKTLDLIDAAEVIVGGERHLEKIAGRAPQARRLTWAGGFPATLAEIEKHRGRRICVLASGDPMHYGAGAMLARRFGPESLNVCPAPGAFSLGAARMGWSIPDCALVTVHGRPLQSIVPHVAPDARLLILSRDGDSPAEIAALLTEMGYGESRLHVFEHLGGADESHTQGIAGAWSAGRGRDLNTVAAECVAGTGARPLSRAPGLPDETYQNDGQLTKREVRAVTLAALRPLEGQLLWDIGAGSGSVAIEWMRLGAHMRALAIERDPGRAAAIEGNAVRLGAPTVKIVVGDFPNPGADLGPAPDAVFVGGGVATAGLLQAAWDALRPGGRLVANAVTLEGEQKLIAFAEAHGGELRRIAIERAGAIGGRTAFKPLMTVSQLAAGKGGPA